MYPVVEDAVSVQDIQDRLLFTESIDTMRCLDEGVLRTITDANVGSVLGIGYPGWTGGVLQHINQYEGGPAGFVARADSWPGEVWPALRLACVVAPARR